MIEENLRFEKILESLPDKVKCKVSELENKLGKPCLEAPSPQPFELRTRLLMFIYDITPEIMKKSGRAELEKVYITFIDLMYANLEYVPPHEERVYITEWAGDWHHGGVEVDVGYEDLSVPASYKISVDGVSKIRKYERKLIETYPVVEVLEERLGENLGHKELSIIYKESSEPGLRMAAGKQLGYSKLRILAHEYLF